MNPGSKEAREAGCLCPQMDNKHGKGLYVDKDGVVMFVIREDCPVHGKNEGFADNITLDDEDMPDIA